MLINPQTGKGKKEEFKKQNRVRDDCEDREIKAKL